MNPALAQAYAHLEANRAEQALVLLQRLAPRMAADAGFAHLMSQVQLRLLHYPQAEHFARRAVQLARTPLNLLQLAIVLGVVDKTEESLATADQALALDPAYTSARLVRCNVLMGKGRVAETLATCEEGLRYEWHPELCVSHASAMLMLGEPEQASAFLDDAHARFPNEVALASLRAMAKTVHPGIGPDEVWQAHKDFGLAVNRVKPSYTASYIPTKDPARKLRVALISPDLRRHSVAFFIEPLLEHFDRTQFEIIGYPTNPVRDEVSARLEKLATLWRPAHAKIELQLAQMLSDDRIDIAIDLAGHTDGNSLLAFALRIAPVQATYCGYPDTTGLTQMDWRIVDSHTDPDTPAVNARASEKLYRLDPCFLTYRPPENAPAPTSDIRHRTSDIVFGSFNASRKHNRHVAALWSRILHAVPNSRLILKAQDLKDPHIRERLLARFAPHDTTDRIDFLDAPKSLADHLALYSRIDIALDPAPYQGTTTTCEALWMGVPVLTLRGQTHAGRVGPSLLSTITAPELIADNDDDFVNKAVALAANPDRLTHYRRTLRPQMAASPLLDPKSFCRRMEKALRHMWVEYCRAS